MISEIENSAEEFEEAPYWSDLYDRTKRIGNKKVSEFDPRSTTLPDSDWRDWRFDPDEVETTILEAFDQVDSVPEANFSKRNRKLKKNTHDAINATNMGLVTSLPGWTAGAPTIFAFYKFMDVSTNSGEIMALASGAFAGIFAWGSSFVYSDHRSLQLGEEIKKGRYGEFIDLNEYGDDEMTVSSFFDNHEFDEYIEVLNSDAETLEKLFVNENPITQGCEAESDNTLNNLLSEEELQIYGMKFLGEGRYRDKDVLFDFEDISKQVEILKDNSEEMDIWMQLEEGNPFYTIGIQGTYEESVEGESEDYEAVMMGLNPEYEVEGWEVEHFLPDSVESPYAEEFEGNYRDIRTPEDSMNFNEFEKAPEDEVIV